MYECLISVSIIWYLLEISFGKIYCVLEEGGGVGLAHRAV